MNLILHIIYIICESIRSLCISARLFCIFWCYFLFMAHFPLSYLFPPCNFFYRKSLTSVTSAEKPLTGVQPSTRTHASMQDTNHSCASSVGRDFTKKVRR